MAEAVSTPTALTSSALVSTNALPIGSMKQLTIVNALNVGSAEDILSISAHNSAITCLAMSPDGIYIASGSHDNEVKVFNIARNTVHCVMSEHEMVVIQILNTSWTNACAEHHRPCVLSNWQFHRICIQRQDGCSSIAPH